MTTGILIPCMDSIPTPFHMSLIKLEKDEDTIISHAVSSLVYDSRNLLADMAVKRGYDRVLWLDSDMTFDKDLLQRLHARLDEGYDMVCCVYPTRKPPIKPCIYSFVEPGIPSEQIEDYPKDSVFEVAGCGFGAVMMNVSVIKKVIDNFRRPFSPILGLGEDLSFCYRVTKLGMKIYCDSTIQVGHVGIHEFRL